jgi:hypothetical protein
MTEVGGTGRLRKPGPWLAAMTTMVAVVGSFGTAYAVRSEADFGTSLLILCVVLAVTLGRVEARSSGGSRTVQLATLLIVAVLAHYVGEALYRHAVLGGVLLVIGLSVPIAIRRLGTSWARAGTMMSLPFVAVLTTPAVAAPSSHDGWWAPVMALIAYVWVAAATTVARRLGFFRAAPARRPAPEQRPTARLDARARMAIQMALSLTAALILGHALLDEHWPWVVITAYVVCSGNRGRGDVLVKGVQRIAGALVGTAIATVAAGRLDPGSHLAIMLIFVILGLATWLRSRSYAYWAAGITAVLALLYGFFGVTGDDLLVRRLVGILIGGAIAVAVSWFVLPIRTRDVARRRVATVLRAMQATIGQRLGGEDPDLAAIEHAAHELGLVAPTWRIHHRVTRVRPTPMHAIEALEDCVSATLELGSSPDLAKLGEAARSLGAVRRRLRDTDSIASLTPDLQDLADQLRRAGNTP